MFIELTDQNNVTTVVNTEMITDVRLRKSEDAEPVLMSADVKMNNGDVIFLDETNWGILRNNIIPQ